MRTLLLALAPGCVTLMLLLSMPSLGARSKMCTSTPGARFGESKWAATRPLSPDPTMAMRTGTACTSSLRAIIRCVV